MLSVLFLVAVISLPSIFFNLSLSPRIDVTTLSPCWRILFLLLSMTHIACQYHFWDIRLYVLSLVFLSSGPLFEIHFKNGPEYLTMETAQVFILFMRFLRSAWFRDFFSFVWDTLFSFFLSSPHIWWCLLPLFPSTYKFPFLFLTVSWLASQFLPLFVIFRFSLLEWHILLCQIPLQFPDCKFHHFFSNIAHVHKFAIFSFDVIYS